MNREAQALTAMPPSTPSPVNVSVRKSTRRAGDPDVDRRLIAIVERPGGPTPADCASGK